MTYKEIVMKAKAAGIATEKIMWQSIESFSDLLEELKEHHEDIYWSFMREQVGIMYGNHYNEAFALYDVAQMHYADKNGSKHSGAHWTVEQIEQATQGMNFPSGVNRWDKYVAFNATYSDLCKEFDDGQILKAGYLLYFADEDWGGDTKVWDMYSAKGRSE